MARIRTIKPAFTADEELSSLDAETHLLAAGLLCYADDEGYFNANPGLVKGAVIPLRGEGRKMDDMLSDLARIGYLQLGSYENKRYARIVNFDRHQKVSHCQPSAIKSLPIKWEGTLQKVPESSGEIPADVVNAPESFRPELNRTELNRREGERADAPPENSLEIARAPEGLHPLGYARGILDRLEIPAVRQNLQAAGAAVEACARGHGFSFPDAVDYIVAAAISARGRGERIKPFWFTDAGYDWVEKISDVAAREPGIHREPASKVCGWCGGVEPCSKPTCLEEWRKVRDRVRARE